MKKQVLFIAILVFFLHCLYAQTPGPNESIIHLMSIGGSGSVGPLNKVNFLIDGVKKVEVNKTIQKLVIPNGPHSIQADAFGRTKSPVLQFMANSSEIVFTAKFTLLSVELEKTNEKSLNSGGTGGGNNPSSSLRANTPAQTDDNNIEGALYNGAKVLADKLPADSIIAIISISSQDSDMAEFVIEELAYILVSTSNFKIVDRNSLEAIQREQRFQFSGDVDDNSVVDIGKKLGANVVITGSISGTGVTRRLRLKALDVRSAEIVATASERF